MWQFRRLDLNLMTLLIFPLRLFMLTIPCFYFLQPLHKAAFQSFLSGVVIAPPPQGFRQAFHVGELFACIMGMSVRRKACCFRPFS